MLLPAAALATALNDYFYLPGSDLKGLQRNGPPRITVKEAGPLLASLLIESDAPGCRRLTREVRVVDGLDCVEIINTIDKLAVRAKEGVHFGFGFDVPGGMPRFDVGWAAVRPELDQIPASCKNWFSVQRWVDISNDRFGVTWSPVDAPLVELGAITGNLIGSQTNPDVWVQHLEPSQTIYSWVMNNHWHTNYRAEQEGPTVFRYAIRPHKGYVPEDAAKFGVACSQPLIAAPGVKRRYREAAAGVVVGQGGDNRLQTERRRQSLDCAAVRRFRQNREGEALLGQSRPPPGVAQRHQRTAAGEGHPHRRSPRLGHRDAPGGVG